MEPETSLGRSYHNYMVYRRIDADGQVDEFHAGRVNLPQTDELLDSLDSLHQVSDRQEAGCSVDIMFQLSRTCNIPSSLTHK